MAPSAIAIGMARREFVAPARTLNCMASRQPSPAHDKAHAHRASPLARQPGQPDQPRQQGRGEQREGERDGEYLGRTGSVGDEELGVVAEEVEQGLSDGNRPQGRDA